MWYQDLHQLIKKSQIIFNLIIEFLTGCKVHESEYEHFCYLRFWDCGPRQNNIQICTNGNNQVVLKHSASMDESDQVQNEFFILSYLNFNNNNHDKLLLPIGVCFKDDFRHVKFLVYKKWHHKDLSYHLFHKRLTNEQAMEIFKQIVFGLKQLHDNSVLHRDLTLNNILVSDELLTSVCVADLGVCCYNNNRSDYVEIGRYVCRPPETYFSLQYDIYGLGFIGKALFNNRDLIRDQQQIIEILKEMKKNPEEKYTNMDMEELFEVACNFPPRKICRLLDKCKSKNPQERPLCDEILSILE